MRAKCNVMLDRLHKLPHGNANSNVCSLYIVQEVSSSEEVLDLLRQGNANRRTEATGANQVSSRSHAVLQVIRK